jgi:hypothetical protein
VNIIEILNSAGYETVEGAEDVNKAIETFGSMNFGARPLCSGYGVFPDGEKCNGCSDCIKKETT